MVYSILSLKIKRCQKLSRIEKFNKTHLWGLTENCFFSHFLIMWFVAVAVTTKIFKTFTILVGLLIYWLRLGSKSLPTPGTNIPTTAYKYTYIKISIYGSCSIMYIGNFEFEVQLTVIYITWNLAESNWYTLRSIV